MPLLLFQNTVLGWIASSKIRQTNTYKSTVALAKAHSSENFKETWASGNWKK